MELTTTAETTEAERLVARARQGDQAAWRELFDQYTRLVWAITRDFRVSDGDASDVTQTTWLRLLEHIDRIDPNRIAAWLGTTARRECLRVLAMRKRMVLTYDADALNGVGGTDAAVDESLLADENVREVRRALQTLPERWQELIRLSMADPPVPYAEISARLGMPIGSIGPVRQRCLARLRKALEHG